MSVRAVALCSLVLSALVAAACADLEKSESPLSPTVAGPIPGVDITQPTLLEPRDGSPIDVASQPITLLLGNSQTSGVRPLSYVFEVATDFNFTNKIFTREGVTPGENGRTSLRLPEALGSGRTYFWRASAQDGANTGPYSGAWHFHIFTPLVIGSPILHAPVNNAVLDSPVPRFTIGNAPRSGPVGPITYVIEVADAVSFGNKFAIWTTGEQAGQTVLNAPSGLPYGRQYFWHARAYDGNATGPWSEPQVFRTPAPPAGGSGGSVPPPTNCTLPQPTPFQTLQCARTAFPRPMNADHRGALMNVVAWHHRGEGYGMHLKTSGNRCPQPRTGTEISCDILVHGPSQSVFDVLIDEEEPTWGYKGPINSMSNFVPPVQP